MARTRQLAAALLFVALGVCVWWAFRVTALDDHGAIDPQGEASLGGPSLQGRPSASAEDAKAKAQAPSEHNQAKAYALRTPRKIVAIQGIVRFKDLRPAAGARVHFEPTPGQLPAGLVLGDDRGTKTRTVRTDSAGQFELDLAHGPYRVRARHGDWESKPSVQAFVDVRETLHLTLNREVRGETEMPLVPSALGILEGDILGPSDGEMPKSVWMRSYDRGSWSVGPELHASVQDGHYRFAELPAGRYEVEVEQSSWVRGVEYMHGRPHVHKHAVVVKPSETTHLDLDLVEGGAVQGRVQDGTGLGLANAWVRLELQAAGGSNLFGARVWRYDAEMPPGSGHPLTHRTVQTAEDGQYVARGLTPGQWRLFVHAPGKSYVQILDVPVEAGGVATRNVTLVPAGGVQGIAPSGSYLGVRLVGSETLAMAAIVPRTAAFTFAGLAPGTYEVVRPYWQADTIVWGTVEVHAGELSWVDLRDAGDTVTTGQILLNGHPFAGSVRCMGHRGHIDREGHFEVRTASNYGPLAEPDLWVRRALPLGGSQTWVVPVAQRGAAELGAIELGTHSLSLLVKGPRGAGESVVVDITKKKPKVVGKIGLVTVHTRSDAEGRAEITGLPAGTYHVVLKPRAAPPIQREVEIPARDVVRVDIAPAGSLQITVVDPDGAPIPRTRVGAMTWTGEGLAPDGFDWGKTWDAMNGRTDERGISQTFVTAGTVRVSARVREGFFGPASKSSHASSRLHVRPGTTTKVRLTVHPRGD